MASTSQPNIRIREMRVEDLRMLDDWYKAHRGFGTDWGMIPLSSSIVIEIDDEPAIAVSAILTNTMAIWLEGWVTNPKFTGRIKREATRRGIEYLEKFARSRGYDRFVGFVPNEKIERHHRRLGFEKSLSVTAMVRRLTHG